MIRNVYWKLQRHPFVLITIYPFKQHYIFLYITIFIWEVRFTCFPKWFGIIISTKFLKVLQFGLFIQICQHVSLSLKLDNVARIFWLIYLAFEMWCNHYLLPKVLIKMGFLIPLYKFYFLRSMFIWNWKKIIFKGCMGSHSRHTVKNVQFKLVTIILFEIAVY